MSRVVRRLVEHEEVCGKREQPREQQAVALAAGQHADRSVGTLRRKQEIAEVRKDVLASRRRSRPIRSRG
jgi:hypothetical protein